jgi:osmotically-inducible protein OsmY
MRMNVWLAALAAAACITVGCHSGPNVEGDVRKALDQANMQEVTVKVDDTSNIVHLKGVVVSMAARSRAEEVAGAVVGTSGTVLNELAVKGLNDATAGDLDGQIRRGLNRMIDNDPTLKQRQIEFEVANGMVTINGEVRTADEKSRIEEMTKAAPGVKNVANGLQIKSGP